MAPLPDEMVGVLANYMRMERPLKRIRVYTQQKFVAPTGYWRSRRELTWVVALDVSTTNPGTILDVIVQFKAPPTAGNVAALHNMPFVKFVSRRRLLFTAGTRTIRSRHGTFHRDADLTASIRLTSARL